MSRSFYLLYCSTVRRSASSLFADLLCILFVMLFLRRDAFSSHPMAADPPASGGAASRGFLGLTVVNVYKYIFCMYAFPNDLDKIDVIFIYCSGFFVSILYF